jgi:hypothetical protein
LPEPVGPTRATLASSPSAESGEGLQALDECIASTWPSEADFDEEVERPLPEALDLPSPSRSD